MTFSNTDTQFMRRALTLAGRGAGTTSPNPCVGAVVVRAGKIVGAGWHKKAGGPHAEIFALRGVNARGSTLYVTLEPCSTQGRTPPCTEAIIAAGIKRVVVAARDPNPRHAGRGLKLLRRAGIKVEEGLLVVESTRMNAAFNKWITTGLPLVIGKVAASLDGKTTTKSGDSKWITSNAARRVAHQMRAQVDAVMVGAGTVIADDPQLTVRHGVRGRQPVRIVVDTRGRCPVKARVFRAGTWVVTGLRSKPAWRRQLEKRGVTVIVLKTRGAHVNMRTMLRELGRREITSVLVEGGGGLLGALFAAKAVDRVAHFIAPKIIGDARTMADVREVGGMWRRIGDDEMLFEGDLR